MTIRWKYFREVLLNKVDLVISIIVLCFVFQGPVAGVAQPAEWTPPGRRAAGHQGLLQRREQRDEDLNRCTYEKL